jgi:hypothetical protein
LTAIRSFVEEFISAAKRPELSAPFHFGVDYSPRQNFFIRGNFSREINSSQNSIQSRQYCAALGCGDAAAARTLLRTLRGKVCWAVRG